MAPLDGTFGGQVVFAKGNESGFAQGPAVGNQFFGHCRIAADGVLTVDLRDIGGAVLWSTVLEPEPVPGVLR